MLLMSWWWNWRCRNSLLLSMSIIGLLLGLFLGIIIDIEGAGACCCCCSGSSQFSCWTNVRLNGWGLEGLGLGLFFSLVMFIGEGEGERLITSGESFLGASSGGCRTSSPMSSSSSSGRTITCGWKLTDRNLDGDGER